MVVHNRWAHVGAVALFQMGQTTIAVALTKISIYSCFKVPLKVPLTLCREAFLDEMIIRKEYIYIFIVYKTLDNYKNHKFLSKFFKIPLNVDFNN